MSGAGGVHVARAPERVSGRGAQRGIETYGRANSLALRTLRENYGIDTSDARSKSWDEFVE